MKKSQLVGALEGLRTLELADLPRYKDAVTAGEQMGWGYYFPYLISRNRTGRRAVLIGEDRGSFCLYVWRRDKNAADEGGERLDLALAPTPASVAVVNRCIERANDFNGDRSARILRVDEHDVDKVAAVPGLQLRPRKVQYVYTPSDFGELTGGKYRTLRRNVASVDALSGLFVKPYTSAHAPGCEALLKRWGDRHRENQGTSGGVGSTKRALKLLGQFPELDLRAEVVLLDDRVVAFALGGEIRPGVGCFFDAKSDADIQGLSYFHRYRFLSSLTDCKQVNDGSDVGRAGLRQLKTSLRPSAMHEEFRASQTKRR
ncbi:MAG: hypothetical protein ACI9QQ_001732 [Myxococcota bacterium]